MRNRIFITAAVIALMGLAGSATAQIQDDEPEVPVQNHASNLKQEQRQLELQLRQALQQVDSQLNATARILQKGAAELEVEVREELEARKPELEASRRQLKEDLRQIRSRTASEWELFKQAVSERLEELQQELE